MSQISGTPVQLIRNDHSSVNITTGAWVQLDSSLDKDIRSIQIYDSSTKCLKLGIGASGSEVDFLYIPPGGNGLIPLHLPSGVRLAVRAVDANATTGQLVINMFG